ncbi:hypothetical protein LSUE1_G009556 [Lachnellula suecica]|uniref:Uncharacterized protein n=1 Tax=Lachnellula suecica TaxID=602035 RepID=A0A8T9BXG5_9HELO|nr:hypothetical protein LSUE1_G009556 [Lachnellula suecica]
MARNGNFGIDKFLRSDGSGIPGFDTRYRPISTPQACAYSKQQSPPPASPTYSARSSGSVSSRSTRRQSGSYTSSHHSSTSTRSSVSIPPWQPNRANLNQFINMARYNYGYDLPCECTFTGCRLRFHPESFEDWISHTKSHFVDRPLPVHTICTFCPREFDCTNDPHNASVLWDERMVHIGAHFLEYRRLDGVEVNHPRPDFWTLEHMFREGLMSREDHSEVIGYSERPPCDNMYPLGYKSPEMIAREERDTIATHDIEKEERQRKKEHQARKGKGKHKTHRHH